MSHKAKSIGPVVLLAILLPGVAHAGVTTFQNGLSPAADYAGCTDTWISPRTYESKRAKGARTTMQTGPQRSVLIRFDLSDLPKGEPIAQAVLRLAEAGYPRPERGGQYAAGLKAYVLTAPWNDNSNWAMHTQKGDGLEPGEWKTPGGEIDKTTDFGAGEGGVAAGNAVRAGPWGHVHQFDVTEVVRRWRAGKAPNHGLLIKGRYHTLATSEWAVVSARPRLIVAHGADKKVAALPPPPTEVALHPVAATADAGKGGDYTTVRVGQNPNCALRGDSTDTYVKTDTRRFPGPWGWMNQCRVGGMAGDFNRALLYFDLSDLPKGVSIKSARLMLSLVRQTNRYVDYYRHGAYLVTLPGSPGWSPGDATGEQFAAGKPWPAGGAPAAAKGAPVAVAKVIKTEEAYRNRKRKVSTALAFDLTGAVRAWTSGKTPNCGIMLDNRIEGGAYDFFSCRALRPELRPYIEITIAAAVGAKPRPVEVGLTPPRDEHWIGPMRKVHARFKGTPGTLAQYGDSITVTMAFLAPYGWGKKISAKNVTPEVARDIKVVESHGRLGDWKSWKGGPWGCAGSMKSTWLLANIDAWQKKMNPEASVIMFGTNDLGGGPWPPAYTENMAASIRRMLADGTVPMLTSIPPSAKGGHREYWLAALAVARGLRVPLIDYYAEVVRRRPDDWNGKLKKFADQGFKGYGVPTLVAGDGIHPSNPKKWTNDWSEDALNHNGFSLRNYMTVRMYAKVIEKVLKPQGE